jgi:hypothetical protein
MVGILFMISSHKCTGKDHRFAYRTNGGAATAFGVDIRQERRLIPGVLLVRRLDYFYPCYKLDVTSMEVGISLRNTESECRDFQGERRDYRLKPFLYF